MSRYSAETHKTARGRIALLWAVYFREVNRFLKKLISCILALLLLTTAAFAVPGDSCVVLGEELTLGETDGIFTALGVERGTAMELALSRSDAETYFSDVPEKAASVGVFVRIRSGGEGLSLSLSNITGAETAIAAALTAAGVTDAEIVAAAPEETGALAILPAVFKAYETLTCQPLDPEAKETAAAALREADALSGELDTSKLEELLGAMTDFFDELAALSDDELRERIRSIAAEHGMTLNDAQTQQLADLFRKIQSIGGSNFAERVQDLPETVEKIRESGESALSTAGTVWDSIRGFFQRVGKTLSAIFGE